MSPIRSNAHPVIMFSGTTLAPPENFILSYYRDVHDGEHTILDLLWLTQLMRVAYDSPRIGGGIDPEIATLGMGDSLDGEREEPGTLAHYILESEETPTGAIDGLGSEYIQDMIVHAEAVALKWLGVFTDA